ncbi:MAG: VWA domain-containing protein [Pyrinomonadaceae bacterium]|nr:VWA domain-containing protein [Pyrinomonadaceae bacterium]
MKKFSFTISLGFFLCFSVQLYAQKAEPTPPTTDDDVVKITTKLVQFDAVVTGKNGNQVKDLSVEDFEILQDGKPQSITNFSYVNTESPAQSSPVTIVKNGKNVILPPPVRIRPENAGRLITFIVDDANCTASFIGMNATKDALKKFVGEQMLPNDVVAIYRTRGGSSLLQQYTSDKNQLLRVARQIRWYPPSGSCSGYNGDFFEASRVDATTRRISERGTFESDLPLNLNRDLPDFEPETLNLKPETLNLEFWT